MKQVMNYHKDNGLLNMIKKNRPHDRDGTKSKSIEIWETYDYYK